MMECSSCQTSNRLGAIFCRSCGAKLELDGITSQTFAEKTVAAPKDKKRAKRGVRRIIFNVIRLVFLAALVYGTYLALQLPDAKQPATSGKEASKFQTVMQEMLGAADQKRTSTKTVTVKQLNSYLSSMVGATQMTGSFQISDTWVLIAPGSTSAEAEVTWVVDAKLLGRPLRFQWFGTAGMNDQKVSFTPKGFFSGRFGNLPCPTPLMQFMTLRLKQSLFDKNEQNRKFLAVISDLKFQGDKITVTASQ